VGMSGTLSLLTDSGATHTATARLQEVRCRRVPDYPLAMEVEWDFVIVSPFWKAAANYSQVSLSSASVSFDVGNLGNYPVSDALITVTAKTTAITQIQIGVNGTSQMQWAGTIAINKSLVIDCGALSVKNDGADAYSGFTLTANHKIRDWLRLGAGTTTLTVARTGGGATSTIRLDYYDGWA
jgi:hypothetical protein